MAALDDDNTTFHREKALDDAFDRQVSEGRQRLARPRPQQFITGVMGGMEISLGILIGMRVTDLSGSQLLGGVAFSLGFITLLLAHSELFTEGFLVPTSAVVARRARILQLVRFWFYTFLGNLVGGFVVMWATTTAFPDSNDVLIHHGEHFASLTPDLKTVLMAIIAGTAITLMTRMQMGTSEVIGKIVAALFGGILLFGFGMLHSVLDTLIMLGAWCAGASVTYLDILGFLWWVIPLNMFGGIVCVAMPAPSKPGTASGWNASASPWKCTTGTSWPTTPAASSFPATTCGRSSKRNWRRHPAKLCRTAPGRIWAIASAPVSPAWATAWVAPMSSAGSPTAGRRRWIAAPS
ncbi:MAG: formate/nitrite transporter family protein [Lawsonella clevelandensis]